MKIKLYKKMPKCPRCKVPMSYEKDVYTEEQQKIIDCEHEWDTVKETERCVDQKCSKCGESIKQKH